MRRPLFAALIVSALVSVPVAGSAQSGVAAARMELEAAQELYAAGNWETAREAYERARAAAPAKSVQGAQASLELSSLLWELGEYADAKKEVREAMRRAKAVKLDHAVGRLMLTLGHIEASLGEFSAAESTLRICVKSADEQGDAVFASLCRMNLRFVRQIQGKSPGSEEEYRRDLASLEKSGQAVLVGTALSKSAELQERARDFAGALNTLKSAQKHFEISGSVPSQARNRLRLAQAYQSLGQWDEAARELDGLILKFKNMNNRPSLVTAYALRGRQRSNTGEGFKALADLDQAFTLAKQLKSPTLIANTQLALCEHHAVANHLDHALEHCDAAESRFRKVGAYSLAARAQILGARVAQHHKKWLAARDRYTEAIATLEDRVVAAARDPREVAVQRANLCQVVVQLESNGAYRRCREAKRALEKVKASDVSYRQMWAATIYGVALTIPNDPAASREGLAEASRAWESLGQRPQAAEAALRLGKLEAEDEKLAANARRSFERALSLAPDDAAVRPLRVQIRIQLIQRQLAEKDYYAAKMTIKPLLRDAAAENDRYSQAWGYNALASAELKTKERERAIEALETGLPFARGAKDAELLKSMERNLEKLRKGASD